MPTLFRIGLGGTFDILTLGTLDPLFDDGLAFPLGFSPDAISDPRIYFADADLYITWTSSAPSGTWYQVYVNRELLWSGQTTNAHLPWQVGACQIDIGTVGSAADSITDFSSTLTAGYANRAMLAWEGGSFQGQGLDHFAIYSGTVPGGAVSFARPIDTVTAYEAGIPMDGWGMGGFGHGGWGHAASSYTWRSGVLAGGVWNFAVVPVDFAGNPAGSPATTSVTITAPPRPPAPDANGVRLHATTAVDAGYGHGGFGHGGYDHGSRFPTLTWSASP